MAASAGSRQCKELGSQLALQPPSQPVLTSNSAAHALTICLLCYVLQVVLRYDAGRGPITALAITPEGCFLAGECGGRHWAAAQYRCASGVLAVAPRAGSHQSHTSSCPLCCHAAGTAEGSLVLFAPDPRRRITRRFNLAA